jgi:Flp pilus assembly protein TadD
MLNRQARRFRQQVNLFVLLVLLPFASQEQTKGGPQDNAASLEEARREFIAHELNRADTTLRAYLTANPSSADGMYLLGRVLQAKNQPKESLQWFTKAAAISRPSSEDLRIVALDYVLLNDYADSIRWLNKSLEMNPRNSEAWYDLARTKMMQGDYSGAEAPMKKALILHPKMVKAENNLGLIYEAQNRPAEAADAYRLAVEWQKTDANPSEQPLLNYGTLLIDEQRSTEAISLLEQAVTIAPNNVKCYEQLARALDRHGEGQKAVEQMQAAVRLDPHNPRLHYQLGLIYRRVGEPEKSKEEMLLSEKLYGPHSSEPTPQ